MDTNDVERNRRSRDEKDDDVDIKATVQMAQNLVNMGIMSESEALKYYNISRVKYEQHKQ